MRWKRLQNVENRPWTKYYKENERIEIPEMSLYQLLEQSVAAYGDKTAIIYDDENTSYRQLKEQVDLLAGAWKQLGFQKGERIGLMLANHPDYVICYYAAQALGLTVVQINPMYTPRELLQIVNDSTVSYIVGDPVARKTIEDVHEIYGFKYLIGSQIESWGSNKFKSLDELILFSSPLEECAKLDVHEDIAVIQYTGGTTGKMKGAMLTHYNLVSNVVQSHAMYGDIMVKGEETVLAATPLYHVYAMTSGMNLGIYIGARLLLIRKFDVTDVLEKIKKYQPTFFPGVPQMYIAFLHHPKVKEYGLDSFKTCTSGSAPLPVEVLKRFEELTGASIGEGFGLSEASPTTHRNPPFAARKVGSIGIPMPDTDCQIIDDHGNKLGTKSVGELLIKGPQVMKGYWGNEEETKASLQNGWLHTGDLAMMDDDGYFYIVGRKKEMIIVGGFNIYPQEIEGVLYEYPDIQEAAVAGIPHEKHGEIVKAFVVPKKGSQIDLDELKGYCYSKLTPYKVPKSFEIRESLPRNTVGKLLKRLLVKEELEKEANKNAD